MEETKRLCELILEWWEAHQFDVIPYQDGEYTDGINMYKKKPEFVILAEKYFKLNINNPKNVIFFPNGNTFCSNSKGEQIPELQKSWFSLYLFFLESKGVKEIENISFELNGKIFKPFKTENGYNWY